MSGPLRVVILLSVAVLSFLSPARSQGFAEALKRAEAARLDSIAKADASRNPDSVKAVAARRADSLRTDSLARLPKVYRWANPLPETSGCPEASESASLCWREDPRLANQDIGLPGTRARTLSLTRLEPIAFASPFFPADARSPYGSGGRLAPDRHAVRAAGGDVSGIEEVWSPVVPLDTPVTNLEWERGALTLNMFHLKLRRMLSARSYLALDYYSASADSQAYDYQFNVHQPYLGGWGFLGQIYAPIDRDSASLVLEGLSPTIDALNFRPRLGFWLDTNQVLEIFLDRVKNNTSLTRPRGLGMTDSADRGDSVQTLMPSAFQAYSGGVLHGYAGKGWSTQWEAVASAAEKNTFRFDTSSLTGGGRSRADAWEGDIFRVRGRAAAPGLPLAPYLEAEGVSETWSGDLFLTGAGKAPVAEGWTDRMSGIVGIRPDWGWLALGAEGGATRNSRMDASVSTLGRWGLEAALRLPLGLEAGTGVSYVEQDPDWETLYRHNPSLFLFPSPGLAARRDFGGRASVAWKLPWARLEAGWQLLLLESPWLPMVLPSPEACDAVAGGVYLHPGIPDCVDGALPDSLALRLRNWGTAQRSSWRLGLGMSLGNWSLDLGNHFLVDNQVGNEAFTGATFADRSLPERVFKGKLWWRRGLLEGKLKVDVGWGWEWFSTRYAWTPDLRGMSTARKLDEYLALDFYASMKIRTFLLYFKGVNFNHDRYATEPGVHPAGVNFRFGIDWTLWN